MAAAAQNTNNTTIMSEGKLAHLEQPLIPLPLLVAPQARALENYKAYDMIQELKTMFEEQARYELFESVKAFHACKQEDRQLELGVSLILNSLNKDYDQSVQNYNMHSMGKSIVELHAMLKLHEKGIPKKAETPTVLAKWEGKIQKDKKKPKAKLKKRKNASMASTSGICNIELYAFPNKTWVYDTGYGTYICNTSQGLRGSRKFKHGALILYMGNRMRAVVEAIGSFDLVLPSGLIIVLDNYNVFYFNAIPRDGIYETDMHNLYLNVSSMFNVRNKRVKHALDSSYLWHYRLGHINNKRIDKLQHDGIMQPTHDESLEKCKSCISRKMVCKLFPYQVERAKDLLGLIHTDVCGPFRTVSREGYPKEMMGYYPLENKIFVARNVEFFKNSLMVQEASGSHGLLESSGSGEGLELIQEEDTQPSKNTSEIRKDTSSTDRYGFYVDVEEHELGDLNEPPDYKAALSDPEFDKWFEAMNIEMQSMKDNQVWVLVDLPPNGQTVRSKWLFKKNTDIDGNVHTFKARLVAKGYTQTYGADYRETFSPVVDNRAIRILLAIAILKQASRSWNKRFDVEIKKIGFTQNPDKPCVYLKASGSDVAFLILYVNDILLMGNNITMLQEVKSWLCKCFSMKDLGEEAYIPGIKIIRDRSKRLIALSQSAYLEKILKKFWMENFKKGYTPVIEKHDYKKSQAAKTSSEVQRIQRVPYASAIEAEYMAVAEASMEAVLMRKFIDGLGNIMPSNKRPMEMLCDNEPAIVIANDPGILKGAKHF
ncbi:retrotransposon protein, putative, ty1-copia subclass [Tanacetum coccineum]